MEKRTTYGYIYLGTVVRYLLDALEGTALHASGTVAENVRNLRGLLAQYEFHVTSRVSGRLWELLDEWETELREHEDDEAWIQNRGLSKSECEILRDTCGIVRETLLAEAEGKVAFITSDKRYTVEKLLDGMGSVFGVGVFEKLPDLATFDFVEGGKALAYELPTAAAFHFLRGTEAVLREFYSHVVRRNRIKEPRMWAAMVSDMREKRNAPAKIVLDNLDSLRTNFRNPTQHPEKVYDLDEAQDLLALAIDSINRMIRHQHQM